MNEIPKFSEDGLTRETLDYYIDSRADEGRMMPAKKNPPAQAAPKPAEQYPMNFETIGKPRMICGTLHVSPSDRPCVGNFGVSVERYRVTIERIDEPLEVIHSRLQELWETTGNFHDVGKLRTEAAKFGLLLDMRTFGIRTRQS